MKVYISHYIAGRTEEEIRAAEQGGVDFVDARFGHHAEPVLPRRIRPWCETDIRYGLAANEDGRSSCLIPGRRIPGDQHTVPCYLRADFEQLLKCDAIVMTRGWETSYGAAAELQLAVQAGIAVHFVQ